MYSNHILGSICKAAFLQSKLNRDTLSVSALIDSFPVHDTTSDNTNNNTNYNKKNDRNDDNKSETEYLLSNFLICEENQPQDGDAWLYMSPEELDSEMEARVKSHKIATSNSDNLGNSFSNTSKPDLSNSPSIDSNISSNNDDNKKNNSNIKKNSDIKSHTDSNNNSGTKVGRKTHITNENEDKERKESLGQREGELEAAQLQKMLGSMKAFIGSKSGLEGIDNVPSKPKINSIVNLKTDSKTDTKVDSKTDSKIDSKIDSKSTSWEEVTKTATEPIKNTDDSDPIGGLEIDFEKLLRLLQPIQTPQSSTRYF
jgi:hypothetical protein